MKNTLDITKALADSNRARVIMALIDLEELCVCQLTEMLEIATATVSRHMSILQNAGLVKSRKEGRWVFYRLSDSFPPLLKSWLKQSMSHTKEVALDSNNLKKILCCDPDELCKSQKNKKRRHGR